MRKRILSKQHPQRVSSPFRRNILANTHSRPLVPNGHLPHRLLRLWTANNRKKDRTTIEETIRRLIQLVNSLDEEQKRAAKEGLSEDELALFDLLQSARARQTYRSFAPPPHDPAHP